MEERYFTLLIGKPLSRKDNIFWKDFMLKFFNEKSLYVSHVNVNNPMNHNDYSALLVDNFFSSFYPTQLDDEINKLYERLAENDSFHNLYIHTTSPIVVRYFLGHADYGLVYVNSDKEIYAASSYTEEQNNKNPTKKKQQKILTPTRNEVIEMIAKDFEIDPEDFLIY